MSFSLTRFSWWLWGGKEKEPPSNGSSLNFSSEFGLGVVREVDSMKFSAVKCSKMSSSSQKVKRKWRSREERRTDKELDVVLVPSDGVCLSASESDDSNYSVGWLEPHAPDFQSDDELDSSFAVLVPCYRHECKEVDHANDQLLNAITSLPLGYSNDMEEKTQYIIKLIEEDGDSFAKRAEMYYKKRPELINFVEESYKSYRALAERYDHLSTELQNANNTIASIFPEQVQFAMDEEDEYTSPRAGPKRTPESPKPNIPKAPKGAGKDMKSLLTSAQKKLLPMTKKSAPTSGANNAPKSGLNKTEALEEIEKLQKEILGLQTEKEFVRSSYENGLAKYWEIEKQITDMHGKISDLQDEFSVGAVIEDSEARTVMAAAALKSCQETLVELEEQQERSAKEAMLEQQRIIEARGKLKTLKNEFLGDQANQEKPSGKSECVKSAEKPKVMQEEAVIETERKRELEELKEKIKEQFDVGLNTSLTETEMAESINELVNKVISLETAVSFQAAHIKRLKSETDELQAQIRTLEEDKANLIDGNNIMSNKLGEMEEKLNELQNLNRNVEDQSNNLQTHFTQARCSLDHLSEKLQSVKPDEELEVTTPMSEIGSVPEVTPKIELMEKLDAQKAENAFEADREVKVEQQDSLKIVDDHGELDSAEQVKEQEDEPNWKEMFAKGMEDREKYLLDQYSTALRNYKEVKKSLSDTKEELIELRAALAIKEEEIQALRKKLSLLQGNSEMKEKPSEIESQSDPSTAEEAVDVDIKRMLMDQNQTPSPVEEKFRANIDELLEENLDFWLRFSTSYHQIQKFQTGVKDLQAEILKLKDKETKKPEGSGSGLNPSLKSDARPIYKHLREIQTELTVWLEQSTVLKDELQCRFSNLCKIQEELSKALKAGAGQEEESKLTSYQAVRFQGELSNMKQENNKVADELQVGLDHVTALQLEIEKTLVSLSEEFELSGSKNKDSPFLLHTTSRSRVPLRSFIFGVKQKNKRPSIFSCVNPVLQRKYNNMRKSGPL
ncbi:Protein Networked (NET), actin-binding (NAB) domain [Dillenia turbinata]|uniref:Protein Networked (NET), actin-binding (NAB) domain n=1 Tax=Dillenia turbinata TaxID=194707 RepID=A0AAN8V9W1_9MAGN